MDTLMSPLDTKVIEFKQKLIGCIKALRIPEPNAVQEVMDNLDIDLDTEILGSDGRNFAHREN